MNHPKAKFKRGTYNSQGPLSGYSHNVKVIDGVEKRRCTKCDQWFALDRFYKGLTHCKDCFARTANDRRRASRGQL